MAVYTAINDAGSFFNTKLYTGTDGASQAQTGVGFQPDSTWIKDRTVGYSHRWWNAVTGATKYTTPDNTDVMGTNAAGLVSFDSDGFTVGDMASVGTTDNYVAWNWKAGTTSGIDATGATITPTAYSFNQTSGTSIVQYDGNSTSGATVPHGLGVAPKFVVIKNLDAGENWAVGHSSMGWTKYMKLDTDIAEATTSVIWNDTAPTAVNVVLGDNSIVNTSTTNGYIMYSFADVEGFSRFGGYQGNGNASGSFIYTGFRPNLIIMKRLSGGDNGYIMFDVKRNTYNPVDNNLQAQWNFVENSSDAGDIDILSNGFKIRTNDTDTNNSNTPYVYMCWAESPFVNSEGVPTNAR